MAATLSYDVPLVLAGTAEGTVFAFPLRQPLSDAADGGATDNDRGVLGVSAVSGVGVGKAQLGLVLMKFEHTRKSIKGVSCSREQVGV